MQMPQGGYMQGLRDMIRKLKEQKQEQLKRFNLDSIFEGFRERLDEIVQMERDRIEEWKQKAEDAENFSRYAAERHRGAQRAGTRRAARRHPAQINTLEKFEFINPDAQKKFLELLNELRKAMTNTFFQDIENMVNNLSDGDIERMKDMVKALNDMLVKQIAGEDPGFDEFMERVRRHVRRQPAAKTWMSCWRQMRQQMAAAQSLMNSMSPEQRQALQEMFSGRFGDPSSKPRWPS